MVVCLVMHRNNTILSFSSCHSQSRVHKHRRTCSHCNWKMTYKYPSWLKKMCELGRACALQFNFKRPTPSTFAATQYQWTDSFLLHLPYSYSAFDSRPTVSFLTAPYTVELFVRHRLSCKLFDRVWCGLTLCATVWRFSIRLCNSLKRVWTCLRAVVPRHRFIFDSHTVRTFFSKYHNFK
jgi:hypothetical protein